MMNTKSKISPLFSISPIDGRYANKISSELRMLLCEYGLIQHRIQAEIEWLIFSYDGITSAEKQALRRCYEEYSEDDAQQIKDLEATSKHDVKAVELYLAARFPKLAHRIHFALTSEDINNLAYGIIFKKARKLLCGQITLLQSVLKKIIMETHDCYMLARTHGQPATPTSFGKEMAVYYDRLQKSQERLASLPFYGKCNGASGTYATLSLFEKESIQVLNNIDGFIKNLGLTPIHLTTQIAPADDSAAFLFAVSQINAIVKDLCQDLWLYCSQDYLQLSVVTGEVGSSTMPHKVNPIHFENAEGNLDISTALCVNLATTVTVSRLQRDLSGSTRMRNVGVALAHHALAIQSAIDGLSRITVAKKKLADDLNSHWEILGEAVQTVMRNKGHADAYDVLKKQTRGKPISKEDIVQLIERYGLQNELAAISSKGYSPGEYHGFASELALRAIQGESHDALEEKE